MLEVKVVEFYKESWKQEKGCIGLYMDVYKYIWG